jgi:hypothetical protein
MPLLLKDLKIGDFFYFKDDPLRRPNMRGTYGWFPLIEKSRHHYQFGLAESSRDGSKEVEVIDLENAAVKDGCHLRLQ